jgi:hypothetical protein
MHKLIHFQLFYGQQESLDNSAAMLTSLLIGGQIDRCSNRSRSKKYISYLKPSDLLWIPPCLLFSAHPGLFLQRQSGRGLKLTTHPHLVPQLRVILLYFHSALAFAVLRRDKFIYAITQTVKWWDVLRIAHWISGTGRVVSFLCCFSSGCVVRRAS